MTPDKNENIMSFNRILPEDFDGVFRFTNWTDEDFVGVWGGKEYHFPANTTSPIIIPEHSPVEIQNIRKKFAKDLAEKEFFRSDGYGRYKKQEINDDGTPRLNGIQQAGTYSLDELTPFIQKCLQPLEISKAFVKPVEKEELTSKLSRNEDGELNTEAIDKKASLKQKALNK